MWQQESSCYRGCGQSALVLFLVALFVAHNNENSFFYINMSFGANPHDFFNYFYL
jgi:hypothetical protein